MPPRDVLSIAGTIIFVRERIHGFGRFKSMNDTGGPGGQRKLGVSGEFIEAAKIFVFVVLVAFLAFVAGGVSTYMKTPRIEDFMQRISMVLFYLYESNVNASTLDPFWNEAHLPGPPEGGSPVVLNDTALAERGYSLVLSTHAQEAVLIDMDGNAIHKWARRFDEIWEKAPHLPDYEEQGREYWADKIYWRRAHLYPNGDILVIFETPFRTPYGLGIAKLDKDSNVIWKLDKNIHHDIEVAPDGDIYLLGQSINKAGYAGLPELPPPFIDDAVVVLSPDGRQEDEFSIVQAFLNSDYAPMLSRIVPNLLGDVLHTNTIQYIDEATAAAFDFAKPGDLLISLREIDVLAVLDPVAKKVVWAQTGLWQAQHEPVMMPNGRILVFDNKGNRASKANGGVTRIIEFNPATGAIDWRYAGTRETPLQSGIYGSVQRLAGGNTMIVETINGRAFEVTPEGRVAWDYRSPHRKTEDGKDLVMPLIDVVRIAPGTLPFLE